MLHSAGHFRGYGEIGVNPLGCPLDAVIAVWEWEMSRQEALEQGVDVCVSSWNRIAPNTTGFVKAGQLYELAVDQDGSHERVRRRDRLGQSGIYRAAGKTFSLKDGVVAPPLASSVLPESHVRRSSISVAAGIGIREQGIARAPLSG
jgi:branched-chain amino acid aminotransferase